MEISRRDHNNNNKQTKINNDKEQLLEIWDQATKVAGERKISNKILEN